MIKAEKRTLYRLKEWTDHERVRWEKVHWVSLGAKGRTIALRERFVLNEKGEIVSSSIIVAGYLNKEENPMPIYETKAGCSAIDVDLIPENERGPIRDFLAPSGKPVLFWNP